MSSWHTCVWSHAVRVVASMNRTVFGTVPQRVGAESVELRRLELRHEHLHHTTDQIQLSLCLDGEGRRQYAVV